MTGTHSSEALHGLVVVDDVIASWASYLLEERGVVSETVARYSSYGRPFLESLVVDGRLDLGAVTTSDVNGYLGDVLSRLAISTRKYVISVMRSLLRFLFVSGQMPLRLDGAVLAPAGHRDSGVPRWLSADDVARLLAACSAKTVAGARNRAIITLVSWLGLRTIEASRLSLDDIDWRSGSVRVVAKGGHVGALPLPADVGEVLFEYLSLTSPRPSGQRALFLTVQGRARPLKSSALGQMVRTAGVSAGLGPVGPHRLRHTVATATINAGASLEEVGQLLRHRSLASTTIYAKVDITHLAQLARPWPGISTLVEGGYQG